jgi:hypothetical protein
LILLGSLVSAGGLVFLRQRKRPPVGWKWLNPRQFPESEVRPEDRDNLERAATLAGTRWLTVGALTLFLAYVHGADEGYLLGPWSDVLFHVIFVAGCWGMTALGIRRKAEAATGRTNESPIATVSLHNPRPVRTGD